jgi:hypothetical protein
MSNVAGFPNRTAKHWLRRLTALGMLGALLVTSLGIAVPLPIQKQSDEPYPCMHCACGCVDAEICWRSCCCHTNAEKLAWARKHGVVPPAYVLAKVEQPACCQRRAASCCSSQRSCCEKVVQDSERPLTWRKPRETGKRRATSIVLWQALRCQGLTGSWTLLPPTVIPAAIQIDDAPASLAGRVVIVEASFSGQLPPPDLPPPKNVA